MYEAFANSVLDVRTVLGDEYYAVCPFHDDHDPSLCFNVKKGLWICHACHARGNVHNLEKAFNASAHVDPITKAEALVREMRNLRRGTRLTGLSYPEEWLDQFDYPCSFWHDRGISPRMIREWRLGYDLIEDQAIIPLRKANGSVVGVIRRNLDPEMKPRYKDPKGVMKSQHLFGAHLVRKLKRPVIAIVEGPLDALAMWQVGVPAVAILGSHMSEAQNHLIHTLGPRCVVLMFDNDEAGRDCTKQVVSGWSNAGRPTPESRLQGLSLWCVRWRTTAKDPGELSKNARRKMFDEAVPVHKMTW